MLILILKLREFFFFLTPIKYCTINVAGVIAFSPTYNGQLQLQFPNVEYILGVVQFRYL